jgi:hypothetical protein
MTSSILIIDVYLCIHGGNYKIYTPENTFLIWVQNMQRDTDVWKIYFLRYFAEGCTFMYGRVGDFFSLYENFMNRSISLGSYQLRDILICRWIVLPWRGLQIF